MLSILFIIFLLHTATYASTGDVYIKSQGGLKVLIDDAYKGTTSDKEGGLFISGISQGKHKLKITRANHKSFLKTIEVREYETTTISDIKFLKSTGNVHLSSAPPGATIILDGKEIGKTDMKPVEISSGAHKLTMIRGEKEIVTSFSVNEDENIKLRGVFAENKIININEIKKQSRIFYAPNTGVTWIKIRFEEDKRNMKSRRPKYYNYMTYDDAESLCKDLTLEGKSDWRLPTVFELISLYKKDYNPKQSVAQGKYAKDYFPPYWEFDSCLGEHQIYEAHPDPAVYEYLPNSAFDFSWSSTVYDYNGSANYIVSYDPDFLCRGQKGIVVLTGKANRRHDKDDKKRVAMCVHE